MTTQIDKQTIRQAVQKYADIRERIWREGGDINGKENERAVYQMVRETGFDSPDDFDFIGWHIVAVAYDNTARIAVDHAVEQILAQKQLQVEKAERERTEQGHKSRDRCSTYFHGQRSR